MLVCPLPLQLELVGLLECQWIAIGRANQQRHPRAGFDDLSVGKLDVLQDAAAGALQRTVEAQQFLDGLRGHEWIVAQSLELIRMGGAGPTHHCRSDSPSFHGRKEHQYAIRQQLGIGESIAVLVGRGERAEQIVGGYRSTLGDQFLKVVGDSLHGGVAVAYILRIGLGAEVQRILAMSADQARN